MLNVLVTTPEVLPFPLKPSLVRAGLFLDVEVKNTENTSQFGPLANIAPNLFGEDLKNVVKVSSVT